VRIIQFAEVPPSSSPAAVGVLPRSHCRSFAKAVAGIVLILAGTVVLLLFVLPAPAKDACEHMLRPRPSYYLTDLVFFD